MPQNDLTGSSTHHVEMFPMNYMGKPLHKIYGTRLDTSQKKVNGLTRRAVASFFARPLMTTTPGVGWPSVPFKRRPGAGGTRREPGATVATVATVDGGVCYVGFVLRAMLVYNFSNPKNG